MDAEYWIFHKIHRRKSTTHNIILLFSGAIEVINIPSAILLAFFGYSLGCLREHDLKKSGKQYIGTDFDYLFKFIPVEVS